MKPVRSKVSTKYLELFVRQPGAGRQRRGRAVPRRGADVVGEQRAPDVGRQRRVGDARLLEPDHVEVLAQALAQHRDRRHRRAGRGRDAEPGDGAHPVGVGQRHVPDGRRAPVVADEDGPLGVGVVQEPDEVGGQRQGVVPVGVGGPGAGPVAPHVGDEDPVAGLGQREDLVPPGESELGETVAQDDQRAVAVVDGVEGYAVGLDGVGGEGSPGGDGGRLHEGEGIRT